MNLPVEWRPCLELAGLVALQVAIVVTAAAAGQRLTRSVLWHRIIWQASILGVLLLFAAEVTGFSRGVAAALWSGVRGQIVGRAEASAGNSRQQTISFEVVAMDELGKMTEHEEQNPLRSVNASGQPGPPLLLRTAALRTRLAANLQGNPEQPEPFFQGRSMPWPELVWTLGAGATLGLMLLARTVFFFLLYKGRREVVDGALLERVSSLASQVGLRRRVRIFESPHLPGPIAYGVLKPTVGLPKNFTGQFSEAQQDVVLVHELAHLAGRDPGWQSLADVAAAMLWWHPLVWWARYRLRTAAETAADQASTVVTGGPGILAECLMQLAARVARRQPAGWVGATGPGFRSGLGKRIERLCSISESSWSPLSRVRVITMKILMPTALLGAAILCTAWAGPQQHGGMMKTIQQNWKRSIATLALFAAVSGDARNSDAGALAQSEVIAEPAAELPIDNRQNPQRELEPSALTQDAKLLIEMGKLDQAEMKLRQTLRQRPDDRMALQQLHRVKEIREAQAAGKPARATTLALAQNATDAPATTPNEELPKRYGLEAAGTRGENESDAPAAATPAENAPDESQPEPNIYRMDPRLLERYGLRPRGNAPVPAVTSQRVSRGKQQIEAKLNQIILNEVLYDSLPLVEIVKDLQHQARRRDPAKQGLNFLISNVPENPATSGAVDPTTGMPLPVPNLDPGSAIIKLQLRDVRLRDVLDAMTRVADQPIKYSIEEYGVVISPGAGQAYMPPAIPTLSEPARLQVRTFRVDTNMFLAGLESAFGIAVPGRDDDVASARGDEDGQAQARKESKSASAREIQHALRQLLQQLGINMDVPNKAVFYNELTGIVMVRATEEDLELMQAAIETLGGKLLRQGGGPTQSMAPSSERTASIIGKVNRAGTLDLPEGTKIDVLEAIARVGGFAPTANKNRIEMYRNNQKTIFKFDQLTKTGEQAEKLWIQPGDLIVVHESFF